MKLSIIIDNFNSARSMDAVTQNNNQQAQRKAAMAVLAHAEASEIAARLRTLALPGHQDLREPENGLVMLRGRVGGDGAPFNLGEATVSRAAVRLASGEVGFGYTLGRNSEKARLIALCDALVQSRDFSASIERDVIAPLRERLMIRRKQAAAETAATKVDFYTMVRGEG
ncbi:phosphonate C-P lyase system protein PhnG [Bradyrhizobium hipponense]|uniref:Phosphonate C-P lyase system protein PhnG n=2 Tax=Bradyrhizobium hipponense TaxID=2605638 RepID=A0A5S4YHY2_9BRAD|nr:phosphonate C-P lyase system protein PhnG [Bradyrhizobium hipponense]